MDEITQFVSDFGKRLSRPINDLEDVRSSMAALEEIRQNEIRIDMTLGPIEVSTTLILVRVYPWFILAFRKFVDIVCARNNSKRTGTTPLRSF